jgi:hypothetical protein
MVNEVDGVIKARMTMKSGRAGFLFGITDHNIKRMRDGDPIRVDLGALDPDFTGVVVYIITGTDEGAISRQLYAEGVLPDELVVAMRPGQPMQPNETREWRGYAETENP